MTTTNNLGVTLLEQSQAQKEITINEGFNRLDAVLNKGAKDKDLTTPPGSPASGDMYIIPASATGAWSGQTGKITWYQQGWNFITPNEGMKLWVNDEDLFYVYNGSSWVSLLSTISNDAISGNAIHGGTISDFSSSGIDDNASSNIIELQSSNDTLAFNGEVAQTIKSKRRSTSDSAGSGFTVASGGATSSATNKNGGTLTLSGGVSTGTGVSVVEIKTCKEGSSGTSDNTPVSRLSITGDQISFSGTTLGGNAGLNEQTGTTYVVTASDNGKIITLGSSSPTTITVPQTSTESLPKGFNIVIVQIGSGEVTIAKQGSDNLYSEGSKLKLNGQYAQAAIVKTVEGSPNTWLMAGSLKS